MMPKSHTLYWVTKSALDNWTKGKVQETINKYPKHTLLIYTKNKEIEYKIRQKADDNIRVSYASYATSGPRPTHILIDPIWYRETKDEDFNAVVAATTGLIDIGFIPIDTNYYYNIDNIERIYISKNGALQIKYKED